MNGNMFKKSFENDDDSKRIKDIIGRNQARKISPSFSYREISDEVENSEEIFEQQSVNQQYDIDNSQKSNNIFSNKKSFDISSNKDNYVDLFFPQIKRRNIIIITAIACVVFFTFIIIILLGASQKDRTLSKDLLKKFSTVTNDNDNNKIADEDIDTEFPPVGNMSFNSYFNKYVKDYLIDYLSQNGYCDKRECTKSDAYEFFRRYLEIVIAFQKENYHIDSGLIYETIAYGRSDEEMFLGSTAEIKDKSWLSWLTFLFRKKTDEISKLANKFWREIYIFDEEGNIVGTEWVFSIDKYVAYLMYGDSMTDTSGLGTDDDLNIQSSGSKITNNNGNFIKGNHSYKYSGCTPNDNIYKGVIKDGYIYNRFKNTALLSNLDSSKEIEEKIIWIIQQILNKTVETYGNPNYCSGYSGNSSQGICSSISINKTSLTKLQFISSINSYAKSSSSNGVKTLASYAGDIYDMGIKNNINPELVFVRAYVEGYSPGGLTNNFWGMGCSNNCPSCCINYSSVMKGVAGFMQNISRYESLEEMMSKYAYIGDAWYKGSASKGGCYYFNYISKYYDTSSQAQASKKMAQAACASGGNSSIKTTVYDQAAYSKYQVSIMATYRKKIFNISENYCTISNINQILNSDATIGEKASKLAVAQFDGFGYSQAHRMSDRYVDCSSLVFRTYRQLGINFGGATTASGELAWCRTNRRMINESELQAGDLLFRSNVSGGASHVEIYIGDGKRFGAHSANYAWEDQVSVSTYNKGGTFDLFCRPY